LKGLQYANYAKCSLTPALEDFTTSIRSLYVQSFSINMPLTKSQIIKSYGGRPNFLASFGLKMTPEDIEEGNRILEAFIAGDEEEEAEREAQKGMSR